ncbi:TPA: recombinase family protein [Klebsiella aerogenes]|uniref:recombinase family protein n=1 Tax=Gammaproteobacteria TaxID=1236 RepID=UPI001CCBBDF7|nr:MULTISPECIES: recombinase family protein [Klebsiella]MBZ7105274.1 serine recombinase [Klebsiella michiganensis]MDN3809863.1 recombinase family protein [Klebsiella aerogenes]HBY9717271.1 recombinase family protein [Klebsiella aerogenes]HDX4352421.1 recombinase family protein [Klebsiella michiganensis]
MNVRIYCRASTEGQHADRALISLREFAQSKNWQIAEEYIENASGAKLDRVELMRLLAEAQPGDLLLIEAIDRLSRLKHEEWAELKATLNSKGLVIVSMDLPTSWQMVEISGNDLTSGILRAVNAMLIDILATMARQDYETRRKRQAQGIAKAKQAGLYTGKEKDLEARETVREMLAQNVKPAHIMKAAGISRATFYRIKKEFVSYSN